MKNRYFHRPYILARSEYRLPVSLRKEQQWKYYRDEPWHIPHWFRLLWRESMRTHDYRSTARSPWSIAYLSLYLQNRRQHQFPATTFPPDLIDKPSQYW